jgi:lipoprotein NlpD
LEIARLTIGGRMSALVLGMALLLSTALLAGCGTARVVSEPAIRHTFTRPVHVSAPQYGASATVQRGETLYHIATEHGISVLDLAMWNDVPPPYMIYPGQRLRLSPPDHLPRHGPMVTTHPPNAAPARLPPAPGVTTPSSSAPVSIAPPYTPPASSPPASSPFAWTWPADGNLASHYVPGEPTRQGIDIAGQAGQPIRAAADGVVVYSGSGLVGYGELVIVKHNDAWLSAYGHNRARMVNEGQLVKAGQQIAEMGHSGAASDMLHFEIRYNGKPLDPLLYLPKR